jgi:hypothetical protein
MSDYEIVVWVEAKIVWREPAKDTGQEIIRRQQNLKLQSAADASLEEVKKLVLARATDNSRLPP